MKGGEGIVEKVQNLLREIRVSENQNQYQFAEKYNVSRESMNKYENGERKLPTEIAHKMIRNNNAGKLAITLRYQAAGIGPVWLNGDFIDLHRSAVREKVIEEIKEALEAIEKNSMAIALKKVHDYRRTDIRKMLIESAQAVNALEMYLIVVAEEMGFNLVELWEDVYAGFRAKQYLK